MATATATSACLLLHTSPLSRRSAAVRLAAVSSSHVPSRRRSLLLLLSLPAPFLAATAPSRAADIGLFGIRKRLEKIEEEAVETVKEGEEAVEKQIQTAEKEIESAAAAVAAEAGFQIAGDLVQAGAVAGAEAVGVLIGLSVVNGILGPESQN